MTDAPRSANENDESSRPDAGRSGTVVVVGPDGRPVGTAPVGGDAHGEDPGSLIEQPAKVMRIGSMIKQLLEEVQAAPARRGQPGSPPRDPPAVDRRAGGRPGARSCATSWSGCRCRSRRRSTPSEAELRVAQAQLVGWLEGLFHGIQAALVAQQMAARLQLEQMRGGRPALPIGPQGAGMVPGMPGANQPGENPNTGQYL